MKRISAQSREYLIAPITATIDGERADITGDTVDVALILHGREVRDADFDTGDWEPDTQNARVLIGPGGTPSIGVLEAGDWDMYARVHASPELPVIFCGTFRIY